MQKRKNKIKINLWLFPKVKINRTNRDISWAEELKCLQPLGFLQILAGLAQQNRGGAGYTL